MKQRRGPCNGVEIGVTHLLRWIDAAEQSEHTLRALANGNELAAKYVLAIFSALEAVATRSGTRRSYLPPCRLQAAGPPSQAAIPVLANRAIQSTVLAHTSSNSVSPTV